MDSNLILYPRAYNQRGREDKHSVMGVTTDGQEANVKLRLDDAHKGKSGAPSIAEFARDDRKARQPCIAKEDNGPDNREGVLLFTRVEEDASQRGLIKSYIAKWAVVLAEDGDAPDPVIGYGRLAIDRDSPERKHLQHDLSEALAAGRDTSSLEAALADGTKFQFAAIIYHPESISEHSSEDVDSIMAAISSAIDKHTRMGVVGGILLRARNEVGFLSSRTPVERLARYIVALRRYQSGDEVAKDMRQDIEAIASQGSQVDILPMSRIHSGPRGNQYYGSSERLRHSERSYEQDDGSPALCRVAVRLSVFEDTQNTLLSRIYAISDRLGDPAQLSQNGVHLAYCVEDGKLQIEGLLATGRIVPLVQLGRSWGDSSVDDDCADNEDSLENTGEEDDQSERLTETGYRESSGAEALAVGYSKHETEKPLEPIYLESVEDDEFAIGDDAQDDDDDQRLIEETDTGALPFHESAKKPEQSIPKDSPGHGGVLGFLKKRQSG